MLKRKTPGSYSLLRVSLLCVIKKVSRKKKEKKITVEGVANKSNLVFKQAV